MRDNEAYELIAYLHSGQNHTSPVANRTSRPRRNFGYTCSVRLGFRLPICAFVCDKRDK
jgi:hypothetical protein